MSGVRASDIAMVCGHAHHTARFSNNPSQRSMDHRCISEFRSSHECSVLQQCNTLKSPARHIQRVRVPGIRHHTVTRCAWTLDSTFALGTSANNEQYMHVRASYEIAANCTLKDDDLAPLPETIRVIAAVLDVMATETSLEP